MSRVDGEWEDMLNSIDAHKELPEYVDVNVEAAIHFLYRNGWHTWYHNQCFVNQRCIVDPKVQDYTNYGLSLEAAVLFEVEDMEPFSPSLFFGSSRYEREWSRAREVLREHFPLNKHS